MSNKIDIWSLGCCLYYLSTKRDPFDGPHPGDIKKNIRNGNLDRYESDIGRDDKGQFRHHIIEQLLRKCLTIDPHQRPSATLMIEYIDELVYNSRDLFSAVSSVDSQQTSDPEVNTFYQNKVLNKNVAEFFVKKND